MLTNPEHQKGVNAARTRIYVIDVCSTAVSTTNMYIAGMVEEVIKYEL
jgi:hypothetical protein